MAPVTVQASVLSHVRVAAVATRNVRSVARPQRMAMRPIRATAETEAEAAVEPEHTPELAAAPSMRAPEAPSAQPEAAPEAPQASYRDEQPRQQRRGGPRGRVSPGPPRTIEVGDLQVGKEYDGAIVSIRDFGAFVNIGVVTDGLLHISQISTGFVHNVSDEVEVNQEVRVRVINVDMDRGKFAVTMIPEGEGPPPRGERRERNNYNDNEWESGERPQLKQQARAAKQQKPRAPRGMPNVNPGDVIQGRVQSIAPFGAFVEISDNCTGLLHESEQRGDSQLNEGDQVQVVVLSVRGDKVALSQRSAEEVNQERELKNTGMDAGSNLPSGASMLAQQLARAGIAANQFAAAVGAEAAPEAEPVAAEAADAEPLAVPV